MKLLPLRALAVAIGSIASAQVTTLASLASDGSEFTDPCITPSISADGRWVAFTKIHYFTDSYWKSDIFVRDRMLGTTELVSEALGGGPGNASSEAPAISADGRFVAFLSAASNLVAGDTNSADDVFLRDLATGGVERVSLGINGAQGDKDSGWPSISSDGRFVAFGSHATNLVPGDTNSFSDVFVRDRLAGSTERSSQSSAGLQGNRWSENPSLSLDGRWVVFQSGATNLAGPDQNAQEDVFLRDRQLGTTEMVSVGTSGSQGNGISHPGSVSADGRFVAFSSASSNFVRGDTNDALDVFVRDRSTQVTELVSFGSEGVPADSLSLNPKISADGRFVAFYGRASDLVAGDTNQWEDVFVRDRLTGACERASVDSQGVQANESSYLWAISPDARYVAFWSGATNLVPGGTTGVDVFVRDRAASGFASLCEPGARGVGDCPCSNAPGGRGRGCDNSAGTGGAVLSASGAAYLSNDTLVFTTRAQRPTALSVVIQGDAAFPSGSTFGQGLSCFGGTLLRLYVKTAVAGGILAPDLAGGDPTVSASSASLGDPIAPGSSRYYVVAYRDPIVLGGCPSASTFNATQTGRIEWWP
jgi:Tol biopolymer transport system component